MNSSFSQDLICLKEVHNIFEAEIIKAKLKQAGIKVFLKKEAIRELYGLTMNGLGRIEVMVNAKDLKKAKAILKEQG